MLKISNLYAGYGEMLVFSCMNMNIDKGAITAVIGRNGAGKTSLMRAIMGLIKVQSGCIEFDGKDISNMSTDKRAKAGIGYVPQGRQIFPRLSLADNLRLAAGKNIDLIPEILTKFPVLESRYNSLGWNLSGGEQQILALARALMTKPRLLLVDEPTEGIQPSIVDKIMDELHRINKEDKVTILLTEQNLDFAMELSDKALLIDRGNIVREISPEGIMKDKELLAEYLGV